MKHRRPTQLSRPHVKRATGGSAARPALRVGIVVTAQFTLNALASFVDVLRLASDEGDRSGGLLCQWHLMSATGKPLRASCGFEVAPTSALVDPGRLDCVAVIGGLLHQGRQVDVALEAYLRRLGAAGVPLVGICTGTFVLCRLGLMRSRTCCVSWYHYRDFVEEFADITPVADRIYVVDQDRVTSSGGVGAALAAAYLVERTIGASAAQKALHIMQIDQSPDRSALQPAPPTTARATDIRVNRALFLMEQHIGAPLSIAELASRVGISRRTLERLFIRHTGHGPLSVYRDLRLQHAHWMLQSRKPLAQIAAETGFAHGAHLFQAFRRKYGHSPSEERARYSGAAAAARRASFDNAQPRVFG